MKAGSKFEIGDETTKASTRKSFPYLLLLFIIILICQIVFYYHYKNGRGIIDLLLTFGTYVCATREYGSPNLYNEKCISIILIWFLLNHELHVTNLNFPQLAMKEFQCLPLHFSTDILSKYLIDELTSHTTGDIRTINF